MAKWSIANKDLSFGACSTRPLEGSGLKHVDLNLLDASVHCIVLSGRLRMPCLLSVAAPAPVSYLDPILGEHRALVGYY